MSGIVSQTLVRKARRELVRVELVDAGHPGDGRIARIVLYEVEELRRVEQPRDDVLIGRRRGVEVMVVSGPLSVNMAVYVARSDGWLASLNARRSINGPIFCKKEVRQPMSVPAFAPSAHDPTTLLRYVGDVRTCASARPKL